MGFIVLILIVVISLYLLNNKSTKSTKSTAKSADNNSSCIYKESTPTVDESSNDSMTIPKDDDENEGLYEVSQDTAFRGMAPFVNQPDHTANFWKTDVSQSGGPLNQDLQRNADMYMGSRKQPASNMDLSQASNMHMMSRFASEYSQK